MKKKIPSCSLFKSLGQDQGNRAAAIILSGTGMDGSLGIKEIKANDGLILVQSIESAGYDGVPRSAVNTGLVDMVSPPDEMPKNSLIIMLILSRISARKTLPQKQWS